MEFLIQHLFFRKGSYKRQAQKQCRYDDVTATATATEETDTPEISMYIAGGTSICQFSRERRLLSEWLCYGRTDAKF